MRKKRQAKDGDKAVALKRRIAELEEQREALRDRVKQLLELEIRVEELEIRIEELKVDTTEERETLAIAVLKFLGRETVDESIEASKLRGLARRYTKKEPVT